MPSSLHSKDMFSSVKSSSQEMQRRKSSQSMRCKPGGTTEFFYPKDFKDNTYQIWNFGLFFVTQHSNVTKIELGIFGFFRILYWYSQMYEFSIKDFRILFSHFLSDEAYHQASILRIFGFF